MHSDCTLRKELVLTSSIWHDWAHFEQYWAMTAKLLEIRINGHLNRSTRVRVGLAQTLSISKRSLKSKLSYNRSLQQQQPYNRSFIPLTLVAGRIIRQPSQASRLLIEHECYGLWPTGIFH